MKDAKFPLYCRPLDIYFQQHPDRAPKNLSYSTAMNRGYIAQYSVVDGAFHLIDVNARSQSGRPNELVSILSSGFSQMANKPLAWLTGLLVIPAGESISDDEFNRTFSFYYILSVADGKVTELKRISHVEYLVLCRCLYRLREDQLVLDVSHISNRSKDVDSGAQMLSIYKVYSAEDCPDIRSKIFAGSICKIAFPAK